MLSSTDGVYPSRVRETVQRQGSFLKRQGSVVNFQSSSAHLQKDVYNTVRCAKKAQSLLGKDRVTQDVVYHGGYPSGFKDKASMWSFFTQFRDVIFKCNGSVIPKCWLEVSICTFLGIVARLLFADPEQHFYLDVWSPVGHQLVGVLLAFLTVFRSQIAWSMYLQGYNGVTSLQTSMINFTHVTLSPMAAKCQANGGEPLPREAHELIRLLKLCYFLCVEHLRSSEGTEAWGWAQFVAYSFALPREIIHFEAEYEISLHRTTALFAAAPRADPDLSLCWTRCTGTASCSTATNAPTSAASSLTMATTRSSRRPVQCSTRSSGSSAAERAACRTLTRRSSCATRRHLQSRCCVRPSTARAG